MKLKFGALFVLCVAAALSACAPKQGINIPPNIVDVAAQNGSFNTLVAAVQAAGLEDTLRRPGPYTVFAPTDAAFAKLPPGTVETLLEPENKDKLVDLLTYHVLPAKVTSRDVVAQRVEAATVQGEKVVVAGISGTFVNDIKVVQPDVPASNGVIHVIDNVLLPPE